tara:strand:- start:23296 stop:23670 length:375 start_codon:yes stop_codon:yes gene_type:complete
VLNSIVKPELDEQKAKELNRSADLLFAVIVDHLELTLDKSIEQGWSSSKITIMTMPFNLQYGEHNAGYLLMGSKRNPRPTIILDKLAVVLGDVKVNAVVKTIKKVKSVELYVHTNDFKQKINNQ